MTTEYDVGVPSVWGWLASPLAVLPGWTVSLTLRKDVHVASRETERAAFFLARDLADVVAPGAQP